MFHKTKGTTILILAALITLGYMSITPGQVALGQEMRGSMPLNQDPDQLAIYKESGISGEQENRIKSLVKGFEDKAKVQSKLLTNLWEEMRQLSLHAELNETAIIEKQVEINKVQSDIGLERIKLLIKIRNVLSHEQKERLVRLTTKRNEQSRSESMPNSKNY